MAIKHRLAFKIEEPQVSRHENQRIRITKWVVYPDTTAESFEKMMADFNEKIRDAFAIPEGALNGKNNDQV